MVSLDLVIVLYFSFRNLHKSVILEFKCPTRVGYPRWSSQRYMTMNKRSIRVSALWCELSALSPLPRRSSGCTNYRSIVSPYPRKLRNTRIFWARFAMVRSIHELMWNKLKRFLILISSSYLDVHANCLVAYACHFSSQLAQTIKGNAKCTSHWTMLGENIYPMQQLNLV